MNIGRTIRVLHAEPVGDPRPGEWPTAPPADGAEARAETGTDVTVAEPATVASAPPPE